jgi:hypothetical protein
VTSRKCWNRRHTLKTASFPCYKLWATTWSPWSLPELGHPGLFPSKPVATCKRGGPGRAAETKDAEAGSRERVLLSKKYKLPKVSNLVTANMCSSHMPLPHLRRRLIAQRLWIRTTTSSRLRVRYRGGLENIRGGLGNFRGGLRNILHHFTPGICSPVQCTATRIYSETLVTLMNQHEKGA